MRRKRLISSTFAETGSEEVDLTPLIDVVFVVLILFILIAPMLEIDKIDLASAAARDASESVAIKEDHPLVIHVRADDTICIHKREIQSENIGPILRAMCEKNPKLIPQLFQDRNARFGTYQSVKNAAEEAGFKRLDIILDPNHRP